MQPSYHPLSIIFGHAVRHTVPLFQRPYVWNKEEQWEPLWQDISNLADRVLIAPTDATIAGHFLGTVVLEQTKNLTGSIPRREIIDGQQRLTTLQIVLRGAQHALAALSTEAKLANDNVGAQKADVASRQLANLTVNSACDAKEEQYKVWPTNNDRGAFQEIMDAPGPDTIASSTTQLAGAYTYFHTNIRDWLHHDDACATRAIALGAALKEHLRLIVLDLDDTDEPQAIFETLNANGAPLLPADLMKNWLLWEAARQKIGDLQSLYQTYWQFFDIEAEYWRKKTGTGHAARARVDTFLQNWLIRRTRKATAPRHLYNQFLLYAAPRRLQSGAVAPAANLHALMADINTDGHRFQLIEAPTGKTRFDVFLRRLSSLDFAAFHPLLLELMGRSGSSPSDRDAAAVILESYLVRRVICWDETRAYSTLVLELLNALHHVGPDAPAAPVLLATLAGFKQGPNQWPDDERFRDQWCRQRFSGGIRKARVMMILRALEEHYQAAEKKGEPILVFDYSQLQIEHIMPQSWERHWPLPIVENARADRDFLIQGIGNLTLVSGSLNPTLSNAAWLDSPKGRKGKHGALSEHSKLSLNALLIKKYPDEWTEDAIRARALELFNAGAMIWPSPETLADKS
jgi:Protein of unknown function DUF262/Protein of unknown function (DUF1524)